VLWITAREIRLSRQDGSGTLDRVTLRVDLCVRPEVGADPNQIADLMPSESYGQHGSERLADGRLLLLIYRLTGRDRLYTGETLLRSLSESPLVEQAYLRTLRGPAHARVRKPKPGRSD